MSRVKTDAARTALDAIVREQVTEAAGGNTLVSKDEQKALDPFLEKAAAEARAARGRGARIDVDAVADRAMENAGAVWAKHNPPGRGTDSTFLSRAELRAIEREDPSLGRLSRLAALRATQGQGGASIQDAVRAFFGAFDFRADPDTGRKPLHVGLPGAELLDVRPMFPDNRAAVPAKVLAAYDVYGRSGDWATTTLQRAKIDGHDVHVVYTTTDGDEGFVEILDKKGERVASARIWAEQLVGFDEVFGRCRFSPTIVNLDAPAQAEGLSDEPERTNAGQVPAAWQGDVQASQGRLVYDRWLRLGAIDVPALQGSPRAELGVAAFEYLFERSLKHRLVQGNDAEPFLLGPMREGVMTLGTFVRPNDGKVFEVARWRDIDDGSFTLYFDRTAEGRLKLAIEQFDN
ncbi:hypothetical protein L6R52_04190 [Myxococcota bacterium]|nr:hypothetical protein [Myxococcota bacterium]